MLNRLPRQMPPLLTMLDDIGRPRAKELARTFMVSERTAQSWLQKGHAPHAVMLAIFWLTRWGMSSLYCEAHNAAVTSAGLARARQTEIERLETKIQRLARIANFGSANDPAPGVATFTRAPKGAEPDEMWGEENRLSTASTTGQTPDKTQQPRGLQSV